MNEFQKEQHLMKVLSALYNTGRQHQSDIEAADDKQLKELIDSLKNRITRIRGTRSTRIEYSFKMKARTRILAKISKVHAGNNKRAISLNNLGSRIHAQKDYFDRDRLKRISVDVGWLWDKKVGPIYEGEFSIKEFFVLSAEELSVNHGYIRLYRGRAWSFRLNRIEDVFIGQSKVGKKKAIVKTSAKEAIDAAIAAFNKDFASTVKGE